MPENIGKMLEDLDISNIDTDFSKCNNAIDYQFTSSWSSQATLYFSKNSCDNERTIKGYHAKLSEMIEVWGMGDGWLIWIDYDFI